MENDKHLPTGWHWKITPEQIERIRQRDRDTVNQVYFDNLDKFKAMAYRFCGLRKFYDDFQDCVQQIYIDLVNYDFTNSKRLFWSIRGSFYRVCYSRYRYVSLSTPIMNGIDDITLMDCLAVNVELGAEQEKQEQERHALEIIAAQKHLSDKDKDILTAYAFNCLCYKGLFDYEYRHACSS
ncbi:MAG: hypothetical protein HFJ21_06995 [Clostridia bacterium]|nr:hypothetical protein [Clostridia bacterium]MCI9460170.1 hypothetical protein [Clostridia bacterium]